MNKPLRTLAFIITLLVIAFAGYWYWAGQSEFKDFQNFFARVSAVIEKSAEDNYADKDETFGEDIRVWNELVRERLDRLYAGYRNDGRENINRAIDITQALFEEIFELREAVIPLAEPFFSERMRNVKTFKDAESYTWRMSVLDGIQEYTASYNNRLQQVSDAFRQAMIDSGLPEKYRLYLWQNWAINFNDILGSLGPSVEYFEGVLPAYRELFTFMNKNQDQYIVREDGSVAFTDPDYQQQYQQLVLLMGEGWNGSSPDANTDTAD